MQKTFFIIATAIIMAVHQPAQAQYHKQDSTYQKWFVGTSLFMIIGNIAHGGNPPNFVQLDLGYRLTGTDILRISPKTWKYAWPNGIHPFLNEAYAKPEEKFPGFIREFGITISYQKFIWKGLYSQLDVMPTWQLFVNDAGQKIQDGFQSFNSYRLGYHIKLFRDRFFFQPSICMTHRAFHTRLPDGFKQLDDKWPKIIFPEPGLNIGFNF